MKNRLLTSSMALLLSFVLSQGFAVATEKNEVREKQVKSETKDHGKSHEDVIKERKSSRLKTEATDHDKMPASLKAALRRTQGR